MSKLYLLKTVQYLSGDKIKKIEMGRLCSTMWKRRGAHRVLMGKPEGRRPLARLRSTWEDNIKMDLREVGWGHRLDQSGSGWGQMACSSKCGNEISGSIKCGQFLD